MDPFVGEIRIFSWNWAPDGWALCNGAPLQVQQNLALNALIGQTYGGNGSTIFNLPDLQGRTPIGYGNGQDGHLYQMGEKGGAEAVQLQLTNMPGHNHYVNAVSTAGDKPNISGNFPATVGYPTGKTSGSNIYAAPANPVTLLPDSVAPTGGSTPHQNMQPFSVLNFCIAILGIFPPRQ